MKRTSKKELWSYQEEQFPSDEHIRALVPLLRSSELRELTAILLTEVIAGCKDRDLLQVAEDVNGWIATAEEYVEFRAKRRHILNARENTRGDIDL
jgi:hypothetical protein